MVNAGMAGDFLVVISAGHLSLCAAFLPKEPGFVLSSQMQAAPQNQLFTPLFLYLSLSALEKNAIWWQSAVVFPEHSECHQHGLAAKSSSIMPYIF
jgi:hypothetical protein